MRSTYMLSAMIIFTILWSLVPGSSFAQPAQSGINQDPPPSPDNQITQNYHVYFPSVLQPHRGHPVFGVEMDSVSDGSLLDLASDAGVRWVRRNGVFWNEIEAVEGVRNWSVMADLESEMALLNRNGMQLVLIVRGVPEWARTDDGYVCGPIARAKFTAFASFMGELVRRYSQPPYNVRYWELGNEPDAPFISYTSPFGCWGDPGNRFYGGTEYGKMLKAIYPEVKAADPDAQVLVGGLLLDCDPNYPPPGKSCTMSKFLEGILVEGAGQSFDGVSFHSYDYYDNSLGMYSNKNWNGSSATTGPILDIKAGYLNSVLEHYNLPDKYLMVTESALVCNNVYGCGSNYEPTKAIYIAQSYVESMASRVSSSIWYSYTNNWKSTSLIESSNPKPAYYAFQNANQRFYNAVFRQKTSIEGLSVYEFTRNGDRVWIAWSMDGQEHLLSLPDTPVRMWDLFGSPIPPSREFSIGIQPVYLEWDN